ncbi:MAG: glycosyltransferase family 1 protein [Syntrophales bacterium]|jgi:glycosyltransferase involved in cell wall biosynthesis
MTVRTIGIALASHPQNGGVFQYSLSMIDSLRNLPESKYRIEAIYHDELWEKHLPDTFIKRKYNNNVVMRLIGRILKIIKFHDLSDIAAFMTNPLVLAINRSQADIVIYPCGEEATYQASKPAISAIHDLMHRYEGHFLEYQNGEAERREHRYSKIAKYAKAILVDSQIGKQHVQESYSQLNADIFILPFTPPQYLTKLQHTDVRRKYQLPDRYFFYPAQFWEHKNHINLLNGIKILVDKKINIHMVFVGSVKDNYNNVLEHVTKLNLEDHVSILGYIPIEDMASLYRESVALIFASLTGPTNIPPLEAMLLNCPMAVSNVYAMHEQVGDAAILLDPQDPLSIANAMEQLWTNEQLRIILMQKGKEQIEKWNQFNFSLKVYNIIEKVESYL